jgi:signal transduction histidine kinase
VATDISGIKAAEEALQRQKGYLDALHETSLGIMGRLELHELLQAIIARAGSLVGTRHGFIYLYDSQSDVLVMRVGLGRYAASEGFRLQPEEGLAGKVWRTGQARVVEDYNTWPGRSLKFEAEYADLKAAIGIPLKSGDQLAGVIGLGHFNSEQQFGEDEITILTRFAELASIALDNARLYSQLREEFAEHRRTEEERRKLETQLRQAQKMEAIGTLAGGVAHNFNNLLMGIQGRISLMLLDIDSEHRHFEYLKGIDEDVRSAAELTRQLLGLARGGKYDLRPTDLNKLIIKTSEIFGRTKKEISIHGKYEQNIWMVEVDQSQIEQVMLNLYVNAWQAMPGGGDLYLQTKNVVLDKSEVGPYQCEPGGYVKILVTDTGEGMDEVTRQKIFDPFFTTKEKERGTGLGLASAYGIIRNHGGIINVHSQKGIGTTFTIYLPVADKAVIAEPQEKDNLLGGVETVLVVDDEEMIIRVGAEMLQKLGYRVMTALGGKEGLRLYRDNQDRIDLVVLDMIMPDLSGEETFEKLLELNPQVKVLLSSGYSLDGRADKILKKGCTGFIQKPFNINELSQKLRDILG